MRKNTPHEFAARQEASGTTAHNDFSSSHGCAHQDGTEDIHAAAMVFPNGEYVMVEDGDGNLVDEEELFAALEPGQNVIINPLTGLNVYWRRIEQLSGLARPFVLRKDKIKDVRAFRFEAGRVPHDMLYNLPWRATFGKIVDPWVKKIEMPLWYRSLLRAGTAFAGNGRCVC